jgi:hypothetical protein
LTSVIVSPDGEVLVVVLFPAPLAAWAILSCIRLKGVSGGSSGTGFPCRSSASAFPASRSEYVRISAVDGDVAGGAAVQFSSIPVDVPVMAMASFVAAASTGAASTTAACGTAAATAKGAFFGKAGGGFSGLAGLWLAGGVPRKRGATSMTKRVSLTRVSLMGAGAPCRW